MSESNFVSKGQEWKMNCKHCNRNVVSIPESWVHEGGLTSCYDTKDGQAHVATPALPPSDGARVPPMTRQGGK